MNASTSIISWAVAGLGLVAACSSGSSPRESGSTGHAGGGAGNTGSIGQGGAQGGSGGSAISQVDAGTPTGDGAACVSVSQIARPERRPIDVVFAIDNSDSMSEEIRAVQDRIDVDFAKIISDAGVDYRVIMYSLSTALPRGWIPTAVCIKSPLGATDCSKPLTVGELEKPPRYFQYSFEVGSSSPWCDLLATWGTPDQLGHSSGWSQYLRKEAFKQFVVITDDGTRCGGELYNPTYSDDVWTATGWKLDPARAPGDAAKLDKAILALSPEQFGTVDARNYRVHSIVGLAENTPANVAWPSSAPLQLGTCGKVAVAPSLVTQEMSRLTGGLRYPICRWDDFGSIFRAIAAGVTVDAALSCEWRIPPPPNGMTVNFGKVNLEFQPAGGASQTIHKVPNAAACGPDGGWYYDRDMNPEKIVTCPTTCDVFKGAQGAGVSIAFGCDTIVIVR
jgi:hypothetical protein